MAAAGWEFKALDEQILSLVRSGLKTVKVKITCFIFFCPAVLVLELETFCKLSGAGLE
jgi:hypothetical protein